MIRELNKSDYIKILGIAKYIKPDFKLKDFSLNGNMLVYIDDNKIVGFLEYYINYETIELLNLAIEPLYRNSGIATLLVKYLYKIDGIEKIILEVRKSNNVALSFYKKLGFKQIRTIKNYYGSEEGYAMEVVIK